MRRALAVIALAALASCSDTPRNPDAYRAAISDAYPTLNDTQLDQLVEQGDTLCGFPDDYLPATVHDLAQAHEDDGTNLVPLYDATFDHYCPDRASDWHQASAVLDPLR